MKGHDAARKAWFLDRDGTIIVDRHYLSDPEQVELLEGAAQALAQAQRAGYLLVVVTNQSGIARGYFSEAEADRVDRRLAELLAEHGVTIARTYRCPHLPEGKPPYDIVCDCRKPRLGLFRRAIAELGIDPARSIACGDKPRDVERLPGLGIPQEALGIIGPGEGRYPDLLSFFRTVQQHGVGLGI